MLSSGSGQEKHMGDDEDADLWIEPIPILKISALVNILATLVFLPFRLLLLQ
jgi:hypothetical protein